MLTIIVATGIALSLACIVLVKSQVTDSARLEQRRSGMLTIGVQIICGDCAGEDERPIKTYLDQSGNCAVCGGSSYLLASAVGLNIGLMRAVRARHAHIVSSQGRVIPFEVPTSRGSREQKIAV
jgi:hypothetical protein